MLVSISDLQPYGEYTVILSACTVVGCANSTAVPYRTAQAAPLGKITFFVFILFIREKVPTRETEDIHVMII